MEAIIMLRNMIMGSGQEKSALASKFGSEDPVYSKSVWTISLSVWTVYSDIIPPLPVGWNCDYLEI